MNIENKINYFFFKKRIKKEIQLFFFSIQEEKRDKVEKLHF